MLCPALSCARTCVLSHTDVNGDGELDLEEFVEVVSVFDASLSRSEISKMWFELVVASGG